MFTHNDAYLPFQPIMAIFRPHPGTDKRPIFNVAHTLVGTAAYVVASKYYITDILLF